MKKLILFVFLFAIGIGAYAQKSYVNIIASSLNNTSSHKIYLTGDVPSGISNIYYQSMDYMTIGDLLNLLSEKGFEIEFVSSNGSESPTVCYVLSKKKPDSSNAVRVVREADDSDVHEVARYNLQGLPIGENEKGVQIVVYSNYTTRTIIKE